jgi:hypothetical protein
LMILGALVDHLNGQPHVHRHVTISHQCQELEVSAQPLICTIHTWQIRANINENRLPII